MTQDMELPRGRGNSFYCDTDGVKTDSKYRDEVINHSWTPILATGETVASVDYDGGSITVDSQAEAAGVVSFVLSELGTLEVEVTTSTGRVIREVWQWIGEDAPASDYRG